MPHQKVLDSDGNASSDPNSGLQKFEAATCHPEKYHVTEEIKESCPS
jgi:hypothetical protein